MGFGSCYTTTGYTSHVLRISVACSVRLKAGVWMAVAHSLFSFSFGSPGGGGHLGIGVERCRCPLFGCGESRCGLQVFTRTAWTRSVTPDTRIRSMRQFDYYQARNFMVCSISLALPISRGCAAGRLAMLVLSLFIPLPHSSPCPIPVPEWRFSLSFYFHPFPLGGFFGGGLFFIFNRGGG